MAPSPPAAAMVGDRIPAALVTAWPTLAPPIMEGRDSATEPTSCCGFWIYDLAMFPMPAKSPPAASENGVLLSSHAWLTLLFAATRPGEYSVSASFAHFDGANPVMPPSVSAAWPTNGLPVMAATGISARPVAMPGSCSTPRFRSVARSPVIPLFCFLFAVGASNWSKGFDALEFAPSNWSNGLIMVRILRGDNRTSP